MSKEEAIFKAFRAFMEEHAEEGMELGELNELAQQFMAEYNDQARLRQAGNIIELPQSAEDYLELAEDAESDKERRKYLLKALELEPDNLDALHGLATVEAKDSNDLLARLRELRKKAEAETKRKGYFRNSMGEFWLDYETRPYMRLRDGCFRALLDCGMMRAAAAEGEEMLRLCKNDNLGIRFTLMHIYAYLEDEEAALSLFKRYDEHDETQMLFPLAILYYKLGQPDTAQRYLKRLAASNKDTRKYITAICTGDTDKLEASFDEMVPYGYRPYSMEEFLIEFSENEFLFDHSDAFFLWAREALKTKRKKK